MATWDKNQKRWQASLGTPPNRIWFYSKIEGKEGQRDAERQKAEYLAGPVPLRRGSLGEFVANGWWPFVERTMAYETARAYKGVYERLIPEWLLGKLISEITEVDIADVVTIMVHGAKTPKTARNRVGVLQSIFAHLVRTKRIKKHENPCQELELPKVVRRKARRDLTVELGKKLDELFADSPYEGPVWTAQRLGCRPNETCGLRPQDIELFPDRAILTFAINRQRSETKEQLKNRVAGQHRINIIPREWGERILSYHYPGAPYIFCGRTGIPLNPHTVGCMFGRKVKAFNEQLKVDQQEGKRKDEKPINVSNRELRNMAVSNMLRAGVPIATVADQVGHSSTEITMIYKDLCETESLASFSALMSAYDTERGKE